METRQAAIVAGVALAAALLFQALVVSVGGGYWTYLYYTGSARQLPPAMGAADIARAPDATGFDGQYYHIIAHDPWLTGDAKGYVDNPRVRWRRILVPALAWGLGFGQAGAISLTYVLVVLAFTGLGVFWTARLAQTVGQSPWLALAFLALPATFVSLDRMTVDVGLAALTAGFAFYYRTEHYGRLGLVLALAPLVRETGFLLLGGYVLWRLYNKHTIPLFAAASAVIPGLAWIAYVHTQTGPDSTPWLAAWPFAGLLGGLVAERLSAAGLGAQIALALDLLALVGCVIGLGMAIRSCWPTPQNALAWATLFFVPLAAFLGKADVWEQTYAFGRIFSPLFLLLVFLRAPKWNLWWALPWALCAPRLAWQGLLYVIALARG